MQVTTFKRSLYFATIVLVFAGLLGACSSRAAQNNTTGSSNTNSQNSESAAPLAAVLVTTTEMRITFDAQPTHAGSTTFVVKNQGKIEHSFELEGSGVHIKTRMLQPGESQTLTADLPPGHYDFYCSVPGHAMAGMRGSFTLN